MKILAIALMLAVQSGTLSGEWAVDAPQTEGLAASGENWVLVAQSGGLTLDQKGDAVTGSFKGRAPEPWPLTGRVDGDTFELQTVFRDLPVSRDGVKGTIRRRWIFRGTIDADKLTGTMRLSGDEGETPTQPFTAVRKS